MELRSRKPLGQVGHEPDYRFSLANERTFLAWIRTALALDVGGLGVASLLPQFGIPGSREIVGVGLIVLGTIVAATSYQRWESNERSVRKDEPLGYTRLPLFLAIGVSLISGIAIVLLLTGRLR